MLKRFLHYLKSHGHPKPNQSYLVATSGGVDSVVLCHLFHLAKIPFAIAHCNFCLRNEESDGDSVFVQNLAKYYGVVFHLTKFNTLEEQTLSRESIQMTARKLRYAWFDELLQNNPPYVLCTAHHANDNIETVLLNITRGTFIKGLTGILPAEDRLIRPLLFASKEEIITFAKNEKLAWREDSSNASDKYKRNLIRHQITPILEALNPTILSTFSQNIERWKLLATHVQLEVEKLSSSHQTSSGWIIPDSFISEKSNQAILLEFLKNLGFQENQFWEAINANLSGKQWETDAYLMVLNRGELLITKKENTEYFEIQISENQSTVLLPSCAIQIEQISTPTNLKQPNSIALLDKNKLQVPLTIRSWQIGDNSNP